MKIIKWIIGKVFSIALLSILVCIGHDVGMVRGGGNDLLLPKLCKAVHKQVTGIFKGFDENVLQDDTGLRERDKNFSTRR